MSHICGFDQNEAEFIKSENIIKIFTTPEHVYTEPR